MKLKKINSITKKLNIPSKYVENYGNYKAKISLDFMEKINKRKNGNLVLVTAITPTKAGEGKTTTTISLVDGLNYIGKKAIGVLREPSLGPVFGLKGGATGGGKVTVEPQEDINLHFNGDFHALTSSINLIAAIIDNHIYQGNELNIDPSKIVWNRALDMNDRALRNIMIGGGSNGVQREDHFVITVASELMAVFCLALDEHSFIERVNNIIVAYTFDDKPITIRSLNISKAILKLMKNALNPNIVQTQENNPVIIHGGPFANIAHGCNSLIATRMALKLSPISVTEAGFGADLGAEKFLDIACAEGGFKPDLIVLVASIRALKLHGGQNENELMVENLDTLRIGLSNLKQHYDNLSKFHKNVVVAINHFETDTNRETMIVENWCKENHILYAYNDGFMNGGKGSVDLANLVVSRLNKKINSSFSSLYDKEENIKDKIDVICKEIYRCDEVEYSEEALADLDRYEKMGFKNTYICMAKTPNSFSDNPKLLNCPTGFKIHIRSISLSAGANFLVPITGKILTMPGLPKVPAAVKMQNERERIK